MGRTVIRSTWRDLAPFVPSRRRSMGALVVASVVGGLAEAGALVLVVRVALSLTGETDGELTVPVLDVTLGNGSLLFLAVALALAGLFSHAAIARLTAYISTTALGRSRGAAVDGFVGASWERQSLESEGALQETVSSLAENVSMLVLILGNTVVNALNLMAFLAVALLVDPVSTLVVIGFGTLIFAALRPMARLTRRRAATSVASNSNFTEHVTRTSALAMDLRVFGAQHEAARRLHDLNEATRRDQFRTRFASRFGATLYRDLAVLFLVGAIAGLYLAGDIELLGISTVVLLIVRAVTSAQGLQSGIQQLNEQRPNLDALRSRIDLLSAAAVPTGTTPISVIGTIEFDAVDYEYGPGAQALQGLDLLIEPGEVLGIVGPSGGGKSTLVQLLLGLRPPTRGRVSVHDVPLQEVEPQAWARLVALVPQEPRLMEASVADNIALLRNGITREDVERAAERAHVRDAIEQLPHGFDTVLGPRGGGLSGGQKQRVAIARALVGNPELLVLDEPTSALDVQSERLIQETLEELAGRVTMVIVAHRVSTLRSCNRLIVLRDGRIETSGTPAELLAQPGFFQSVSTTVPSDG